MAKRATTRQPTPALFSANSVDDWTAAEIVDRHRSGKIVLREVDRFWPGVWLADLPQVAIKLTDTGR